MTRPDQILGTEVLQKHATAWRARALIADDIVKSTPANDNLMMAQAKWWAKVCYEVAEQLSAMANSAKGDA